MMPSSNKALFTGNGDWQLTACLNYMRDNRDIYAYGYLEAADVIINYLKEMGRSADAFLYPVFFLCRHHLELKLKLIIEDAARLLEKELTQEEKNITSNSHNLSKLWEIAQPLVEEIWQDGDSTELDPIKNILAELQQLDPNSFVFRYPINNKNGEKHLKEFRQINIGEFRDFIHEALTMLDGIETGISDYQDTKNEMEYEYRDY